MARFTKDWTATNGWDWRLEFVPYDGTMGDAIGAGNISLVDVTTVEITGLEGGFDELPYGLQKEIQCQIKLVYSNLPADMQTRIRNKASGDRRNLWMLWSDRGTGGSLVLEYAGTTAKIGGTTYARQSGLYTTTIDLVDVVYDAMSSLPMETVCTGILNASGISYNNWTFLADVVRSADKTWLGEVPIAYVFKIFTLNHSAFMEAIVEQISNHWNARTNYWVGSSATYDISMDYTDEWGDGLLNCATYYEQPLTEERTAVTPIATALGLHWLARLSYDFSNEEVRGGLLFAQDEYSWASYESAWDWLKDFCESHNIKAKYKIEYDSSGPFLKVKWYMIPPLAPLVYPTDAPDATIDLDRSTDDGLSELAEGVDGGAIGKAETRYEAQWDKAKSEVVINGDVTRASRSYNVDLITSTNATFGQYYTGGIVGTTPILKDNFIRQTNRLLYSTAGDYAGRVHETVTLKVDANVGNDVTYSTTASANPPTINAPNSVEWQIWLQNLQAQSGLGYAIASHLVAMFGSEGVATIDAEFPLSYIGADGLFDAIGAVHELTGSMPTAFPHIGWSRAVVTNVSIDIAKGTSTLTYLMVP